MTFAILFYDYTHIIKTVCNTSIYCSILDFEEMKEEMNTVTYFYYYIFLIQS